MDCSGLCCQHLCGSNVPTWMVRHLTAIIPLKIEFQRVFSAPTGGGTFIDCEINLVHLRPCRYGETNSEMSKRYQTFVTPAGTRSLSSPNPCPATTTAEHRGTIEASTEPGIKPQQLTSHLLLFPTVGAPVSMEAPPPARNIRSEPLLLVGHDD